MNISGGHLVGWIQQETLKSFAGSGWNSNFFYRNIFSPGKVNRLSLGILIVILGGGKSPQIRQ